MEKTQTFRSEIDKLEIALMGKYPEAFSDDDFKLWQRFSKRQHEEDITEARMDIVRKIEDLARGVLA